MTSSTGTRPIDLLASRLDRVMWMSGGKFFKARCPAHDDGTPSLEVTEGPDGRALMICRSRRCTAEAIVRAIGLTLADLFVPGTAPQSEAPEHRHQREVRQQWRITPNITHVRVDYPDCLLRGGKPCRRFWWERDGKAGLGGMKTADLPLYGAADLADLPDGAVVVLVEGERARDALHSKGIPAVGTFGAENRPGDAALEVLHRFSIVTWADNDDPGREHMADNAGRLRGKAQSVRRFEWSDAPAKGDAVDYLKLYPDADALRAALEAAPDDTDDGGFRGFRGFRGQGRTPESDDTDDGGWGPVLPFAELTGPAFPVEPLPPTVQELVLAEAASLQVPVDLPALLALGVGSAAGAGRFRVRLNPDWSEPLNNYFVVALHSGERKSPAYRHMTAPFQERERELIKAMEPYIAEALAQRDVLDKSLQNAKAEASRAKSTDSAAAMHTVKKLAQELAAFEVPAKPRLLADDVTPEALASLLADHGGRIAIMSDEGGIYDTIAGRYSQGMPNLDVYLKGYSGDALRIDRKTRPDEYVPRPAITMVLTVQPDVIQNLADKPGFRGRGMLARNLYSIPLSLVGQRDVRTTPVPARLRTAWDELVRAVLAHPAVPDDAPMPELTLSAAADEMFTEWREVMEAEMRPGGEVDGIHDWANKLPGSVARLAGVLHLLRESATSRTNARPMPTVISTETMQSAITLGRYFIGHAKAAFAMMGTDPAIADAKHLLGALLRDGRSIVPKQDVWQATRNRFLKADRLDAALRILQEHGYIRVESVVPTAAGGRPSVSILMNPMSPEDSSPKTPKTPKTPDARWEEGEV